MRIRALLAAIPLLLLAACGKTEIAVDTNPTGPVYGPATPAAKTVGTTLPADQLPTATGAFGEKPTITFPASPPPPKLQRQMLVEGTGPDLATGDQMIVNYYGIVWGGSAPFDNSYDRGKPTIFQLGVQAVVSGWDVGLAGVKVGSRVLLTLSPSDGYGAEGKSPDIKGTDTLVFVIDVVDALTKDRLGQADAVVQPAPANAPIVTGAPGTFPTVTIPAGLPEPTAVKTDVLALGTGAPVAYGDVYLQYAVYDWTGASQGATWEQQGPSKVTLSADIAPLAGLVGVPVGSRVLLQLPADAANSTPASVFVMDIIYE